MKYPRLDLGTIEAIVNKLGGEDGVDRFLRNETVIVPKEDSNSLLEYITSVTVPVVGRFTAADHFKHGELTDGVRVFLWDNFRKHFSSKVEENVAGCDIRVHQLLRDSRDRDIRVEIGEEREETALAHLWSMLKLQPNGEKGALLTNGRANIFYIRDAEGALWAVNAIWRADYRAWHLRAYSVEDPHRWVAGRRVCSR